MNFSNMEYLGLRIWILLAEEIRSGIEWGVKLTFRIYSFNSYSLSCNDLDYLFRCHQPCTHRCLNFTQTSQFRLGSCTAASRSCSILPPHRGTIMGSTIAKTMSLRNFQGKVFLIWVQLEQATLCCIDMNCWSNFIFFKDNTRKIQHVSSCFK